MRILLASLLVFAVGCVKEKPVSTASNDVGVEWTVSPKPAKVGPLQLTLKLKDKEGQPIDATLVSVEGDMTHPGMVPLHAKATSVKAGEYTASMNLNMPGDWILFANIKMPDGTLVQKSLNLFGVKTTAGK